MQSVRTDEDIKVDIVACMRHDTRVDASDVAVEVENNVVTLGGTVPTYRSMWAAYDDSLLTEGVVRVVNMLQVKLKETPGIPNDSEIAENARKLLDWSADVDATTVTVMAEDGTITLTGSVRTYSERDAAEESISFLGGVKNVNNELAVVPTESMSDEAIASEILLGLGRSIFVDPADVEVKVVEGAVTLSGEVATTFSSVRAERIAKNAFGVRDVNNMMTVQYL